MGRPISIPVIKTNGNPHIYIYILESSARFARAMAYGIILRDYILGLYHRIILRITLRDNITELYGGIVLRDNLTELY